MTRKPTAERQRKAVANGIRYTIARIEKERPALGRPAHLCPQLVIDAYAAIGYPTSPYDGWRARPSGFVGNPLLAPVH